ncbi:MAG: hypothetical protein LWX83_09610 [Anaerolineae bacterium]|nr:hypothetical protein [Anaerolineae bacterium]
MRKIYRQQQNQGCDDFYPRINGLEQPVLPGYFFGKYGLLQRIIDIG